MERELFGKKLADLRKQKGLTQKEVAECLHVTDKAVSKWERGINYPDITLIQPLADCLSVPVEELLAGTPEELNQPAKIVESCVAVAQEETTREKWQSFFKGLVIPLVLLLLNISICVSMWRQALQGQIARAPVYFESPSAVVEKLGQGTDMSFAHSGKSETAEGQTLSLDFHHNYLCGSSQPDTFTLEDGAIHLKTKIKAGEAKLMLLDDKGTLYYYEQLEEGEKIIPLPNGAYQISVCGYWFSGDIWLDINERDETSDHI